MGKSVRLSPRLQERSSRKDARHGVARPRRTAGKGAKKEQFQRPRILKRSADAWGNVEAPAPKRQGTGAVQNLATSQRPGWSRSVLDCGSPLPLLRPGQPLGVHPPPFHLFILVPKAPFHPRSQTHPFGNVFEGETPFRWRSRRFTALSETEFRRQVHSQTEFGNEGNQNAKAPASRTHSKRSA
jgi:hypothetical protein